MKIWQISADYLPNTGGVASHVFELSNSLSKLGHSVTVFTTVQNNSNEEPCHNFKVKRIKLFRLQPFYDFFLGNILNKQFKNNIPDVVHVHGIRPLVATRLLESPIVFTNHTSGFLQRIRKGKRDIKKIRKRMDHLTHVLAPSNELIDATRSVGYVKGATFIPNGVDTDKFNAIGPNLRNQLDIGDKEFVILIARRLVPKNGVMDFAESLKFIDNLNFKVLIAGDGPERSIITRCLKNSRMLERTIFLGNISNDEMPAVYRTANLSVLPSHMEATSITGLESISSGLALVGTKVGGIPEIIKDGVNGFIVDKGSPKQLAAAIGKCIQCDDKFKNFSRASLELSKKFSWSVIAQRTVEVYNGLQ